LLYRVYCLVTHWTLWNSSPLSWHLGTDTLSLVEVNQGGESFILRSMGEHYLVIKSIFDPPNEDDMTKWLQRKIDDWQHANSYHADEEEEEN